MMAKEYKLLILVPMVFAVVDDFVCIFTKRQLPYQHKYIESNTFYIVFYQHRLARILQSNI